MTPTPDQIAPIPIGKHSTLPYYTPSTNKALVAVYMDDYAHICTVNHNYFC